MSKTVLSSLTTRPRNATRHGHEYVDFHCGSNSTVPGTQRPVPVNWVFSGETACIYCAGSLTYDFIGRYSVKTSVAGEYTLRVENITVNDGGIYTCIDNAGFGPEEASAYLIVTG